MRPLLRNSCMALFVLACQAKPKLEEQFALKDLTPPQVVSITPSNGTTEVSDKPTIVIVFSERMDAATLNSSTVTVKTSIGTPGVGSYEYDDTNFTLSIRIVQSLYLNTQYTIAITSQVKDRAGNAIAPLTSVFTTDECAKVRKEQWVFNGNVSAISKVGCTLYVGGGFTSVAELLRHGAALDFTTGQKFPGFLYSDINGAVDAVVSDGSGGWYIGGKFTRIGNLTRNRLARIASSGEVLAWNPGADGNVSALAILGSTLYIGGSFTSVGGMSRSRLAAVSTDGTVLAWNPGADNTVWTIAATNDAIYVGGLFSAAGGAARNYLAAIDHNGQALSFNPNPNSMVNAIAVKDGNVFVGGSFSNILSTPRNYIAAFNSAGALLNWNPNITGTSVTTLLISGDNIFASGTFTQVTGNARNNLAAISVESTCLTTYVAGCVRAWNPDANNTPRSLAISGDTLYAGGDFTLVGGQTRQRLAAIKIDATCVTTYSAGCLLAWNPATSDVVTAVASSSAALYAGGNFTTMQSITRNYLAAFSTDGTLLSWNPNANGSIFDLANLSGTVYVGGAFTTVGGNTRNRLAAIATDGSVLAWNPNADNNVWTLAVSDSTIFAGGLFANLGASARNRLAAINTAGTVLSFNPNVDNTVAVMTLSGTTLYIGGDFDNIGATARSRVASLNADSTCLTAYTAACLQSWNPNANGNVRSLAVTGSKVLVGGFFTTIAGGPRNRLAAVDTDGTLADWNPNVSAMPGDIAVHNGIAYFAGLFTTVGGITRNRLAAVSVSNECLTAYSAACLESWNPNADGTVSALFMRGSNIYVGGAFNALGSNLHSRFASLNTDGSVNW